jgi:O-antigen/teichoic acid export membrane protein
MASSKDVATELDEPSASLVARTGSIAAASIAQNAVAFVATIYVSRLLGPAGRGIYYLPILTATTVLSFCKLGVDQANVYLLGTRGIALQRLSGQNTTMAVCAGAVGLAAMAALPFAWPTMYASATPGALLAAGALIPLGLHTQFTAGLLSLAGRPAVQYRAGAIGALAQIAVLAVLSVRGVLSPATAVGAAVAGAAVMWTILSRRLSGMVSVAPVLDGALLRDTLKTSLLLHASALLLLLHLRIDMFMVSSWMGARALGLYSLAVTLVESMMLVTESVALAILPDQVIGTVEDAARRSLEGARAMVIIGLLLSAGWIVFGRLLIRVAFGTDYLPSYGPLVALLPGIFMLSLQRICSAPALRAGKPSWFVFISGASLACNAALNAFWIPRWGLYGASVASALSYSISSMLFIVWTTRNAGASLSDALPKRRDLGLVLRAVADLLRRSVSSSRPAR